MRVALINGRMSPRSARRYAKLSWLTRAAFASLNVCAVQTEEYASDFRRAGTGNVVVTGNVKFDGAAADRANPGTSALRTLFGIRPDEIVWVAGSTQDPEEEIVLRIYQNALAQYPNLRLLLVPRRKNALSRWRQFSNARGFRLSSAADSSRRLPWVHRRRSYCWIPSASSAAPGAWPTSRSWAAAWTVGAGGQNMIEPAAYGAAVMFGPHTWNFKDTVERLLQHNAAIRVADAPALERETLRLLGEASRRAALGEAARRFVASQQGGTERTLDALANLVETLASRERQRPVKRSPRPTPVANSRGSPI